MQKMNKEFVSVIIPVYNVEKYIRKSIESVINQTYKNLEIIIVDDGSPDNCPTICDEYSQVDSRIKVIHQSNQGLSGARNTGISVATGDYLLFVDSDDYLNNNTVEKLVERMVSCSLDILGFNVTVIKDGEKNKYVKKDYSQEVLNGVDYLIRMIKIDHIYEPVWMYMYKTSLIRDNNIRFKKERLFEDEIWTPEILLCAEKVGYIDIEGYNYIIREGSITTTSTNNSKKFDNHSLNCMFLLNLACQINDKSKKRIFCDHVARLYMETAKYLSPEEQKTKMNIELIRKNIYGLKSYSKYILFRYFRPLYFLLKRF